MRKLSGYGPSMIVLGTAIVVLLAGPSAVWHLTYARTKARIVQAAESLDANPILEQLNQAYRDIATLVEPSVVHVSTERTVSNRFGEDRIVGSTGSGWVFDEAGHIVTNYHVIEDAERIEVQMSTGVIRPAEVVGRDPYTDIAVIKVDRGRLFPAVRARITDDGEPFVSQGDIVFAFGSPFDFRFSMSKGVVSGIGRSVGVIRDELGRWLGYENFIQVDAAINPGNSGGPLTDARGRVIGMNTAIATGNGSSRGFEEGQFAGIGLAIPIDMIEPVVIQIIEKGAVQKGFLGVSPLDRQQELRAELDILDVRGYGLTVGRIEPGNPARTAGLRLGDFITEVNGQPVATLSQLTTVTRGIRPDDEVNLTVWRYDANGDSTGRIQVSLPGVVANGFRGVSLLELDQPISDWLSVLGFAGRGVRLSRLEPDMPARRAGLQPRDVVTEVNGEMVSSVAQLRSRISSMLPGSVASLRVWRYDEQRDRGDFLDIDVRLDRLDQLRVAGTIPDDQDHESFERLGIGRMTTNTPDLAEGYGVRFRSGVLVQQITAGSYLERAMQPGSVIVGVMDRPIRGVEELFELLETSDLRRGVRIQFVRPDGMVDDTVLRLQ